MRPVARSGVVPFRSQGTMILPHLNPDCTGTWYREPHGLRYYWRCTTCNALAYPSLAMDIDAIRENLRGDQLAELTREGRKLRDLDSEGTLP